MSGSTPAPYRDLYWVTLPGKMTNAFIQHQHAAAGYLGACLCCAMPGSGGDIDNDSHSEQCTMELSCSLVQGLELSCPAAGGEELSCPGAGAQLSRSWR